MILHKVRTTRKTGNYVRYFLKVVILAALVASCQKIDTGSDDPRDNLLGTWYCSESGGNNYQVEISKSTIDSTKIIISNFNLLGNDVYAKMNGFQLNIYNQTTPDKFTISGSGTISSNYKTINLSYSVYDGSGTEHVTAVYTK